MALSISGYNPGVYKSETYLPDIPLDLVSKVMDYKQGQYDQNFAKLQNQKSTALNIKFLNKERQGEVDELNKSLQDKFESLHGDYGDIGNSNVMNQYTAWFDEFRKNTDLIHAYDEDKRWRSELEKVQSLKQSKDPAKAGYSQVNEFVFNSKLNDYVNSTKGNKVDFRGYTPYKDVVESTTKIYKNLPKKKIVNTRPDPKNPGYMITETIDGYTDKEMYNVLSSMGGDLQEQFRIEAEYNQMRGLAANPQGYRDNLFNSYTSMLQNEKSTISKDLSEARQKAALSSTQEEKEQYFKLQSDLEGRLTDLNGLARSKEWFDTADKDMLLNFATQLHTQNKVKKVADGLAAKTSVEYKIDQSYYTKLRIGQAAQQFNDNLKYRASQDYVQNKFREKDLELKAAGLQLDAQDLQLKKEKQDSELGKTSGTTGSTSNLFDGSDEMQYAAMTKETANRENYYDIERKIQTRSFNVADGANYGVLIANQPQSNDQILEKVISMYDDNTPGQSISKINKFLQTNNLQENVSINTMLNMLPQLMSETKDLGITDKVGAVKTRLNEGFEGKLANHRDYKVFNNQFSAFNIQRQREIAFNQSKTTAYNEVTRALGITKPWEQLSDTDKGTVATQMSNWFMENNKMPVFGIEVRDYQKLGNSPKKGEEGLFEQRTQAKNALKNITEMSGDIPAELISSIRKDDDGKTTYFFKSKKDFESILGDDYETVTGQELKNVEGGKFEPSGKLVIKTNPLNKVTDVDRMIANGMVYPEIVPHNGQNHFLKLYKSMEMYYAVIDGVTVSIPNQNGATPSQALAEAKRIIQSQK